VIYNQATKHHSNTPYPDHLKDISRRCRQHVIDMLTSVNSSHLGCSFSIIDILVVLYHQILNVDLIKQQDVNRDYVILSKGHAAAGLYAVLSSVGLLDPQDFKHYHTGYLAGHPMRDISKGIEASTGSLGHGLAMGVGLALAAKHDQRASRVYVIVGDGECQEGSIWEALTLAARFKLDNMTIIVDYNNLQGLDRTNDIMLGTLEEKFRAFCCNVFTSDGHHHGQLTEYFNYCGKTNQPDVIIAHTVKGRGISFIEDKLEWHYRSFKPEQYKEAKREVGQ
jgi:transketolase